MKIALQIVALTGLALTLFPAAAMFGGLIGHDAVRAAMLLGMVLWFGGALAGERLGSRPKEPRPVAVGQ
jgi:hypothetical protein